MSNDYILMFDARGATREAFSVPAGKHLYLTRAPQVRNGTATVVDVRNGNREYVIPDDETVVEIENPPADVTFTFMRRSNDNITFVMATVKST